MDLPETANKIVRQALDTLRARIQLLLDLPNEKLDRLTLQNEAREIGGKN